MAFEILKTCFVKSYFASFYQRSSSGQGNRIALAPCPVLSCPALQGDQYRAQGRTGQNILSW